MQELSPLKSYGHTDAQPLPHSSQHKSGTSSQNWPFQQVPGVTGPGSTMLGNPEVLSPGYTGRLDSFPGTSCQAHPTESERPGWGLSVSQQLPDNLGTPKITGLAWELCG
jgi:hypothetical protein